MMTTEHIITPLDFREYSEHEIIEDLLKSLTDVIPYSIPKIESVWADTILGPLLDYIFVCIEYKIVLEDSSTIRNLIKNVRLWNGDSLRIRYQGGENGYMNFFYIERIHNMSYNS